MENQNIKYTVEFCGTEPVLIIMHRNEYEDFRKSEFKLRCLENSGVDNWEGYDSAMEVFEKGDE